MGSWKVFRWFGDTGGGFQCREPSNQVENRLLARIEKFDIGSKFRFSEKFSQGAERASRVGLR